MRRTFVIAMSVSLLLPVCGAAEQAPLKEQKAKDSYSVGYEFGSSLRQREVEVDIDILLSAVREGLEGKNPALGAEEMHDTLLHLEQKMAIVQDKRKQERAAKNLEEGRAFLAANKAKEGVKTLPSGLQYKVLKEGTGPSPKPSDTVTVNYRGTLLDGTEFDSSYRRGQPATIVVNPVLRGWTEALPLMKVGSKWQIVVPTELAYGERQAGPISPNSTLIFEVELVSIGAGSSPAATSPTPTQDRPTAKPSS